MSKSGIIAGAAVAALIGGAIAAFAVAWRPAIEAIEPPAPQSFDPALVKRGRDLAAIGNCSDCHTVRGGKTFAGGLPVPTPFGTIYSSNITPDPDTGIGRWSEAAFRRAMRSGVDRDGQHLYPTFPYDHFTNVTDEDDRALYAFLMTRPAGSRAAPAQRACRFRSISALSSPAGSCCSCSRGTYQAGQHARARNGIAAPIWSRGWRIAAPAIPRAMRLARKSASASFAGGDVDNWHAYAINAQSPVAGAVGRPTRCFTICARAGIPITASRAGRWRKWSATCRRCRRATCARSRPTWPSVFGAADAGSHSARRDAALRRRPNQPSGQPASQADAAGASIYAAACATCHETDRPLPYGGINLALSAPPSAAPIRATSPTSCCRAFARSEGERSPIMPGFANSMTDDQIAALLNYLRAPLQQPAGLDRRRKDRRGRQAHADRISPDLAGPDNAPADPTQRDKP